MGQAYFFISEQFCNKYEEWQDRLNGTLYMVEEVEAVHKRVPDT